jgi:glycosyltransferase involved in cell wall biosynthesis
MAISTNIGRNHELMDDNISGFIAEGATVALVDDALERAWQQRDRWQEIGKLAGQHIRERYPEDPIGEYADKIQKLLEG